MKGTYFDAYVMIDIYSRYIVGVHVHAHESGVLAKELMEQIFAVHGIPQIVHADRGTSMTSKTVAALLADLEVTRSHSRPPGVPFNRLITALVLVSDTPWLCSCRGRTGRWCYMCCSWTPGPRCGSRSAARGGCSSAGRLRGSG